MSRPKIDSGKKSKFNRALETEENEKTYEPEDALGILKKGSQAQNKIKGFRFGPGDLDRLKICLDLVNSNNESATLYTETDIMRAALYLLSQQTEDKILKGIQACK
jgi:hypothetical protein